MENKNSYLQNKIEKLEHRIKYLEELLERNNISYAKEFTSPFNDYIFIKEEEITPKHAKLFYSMFKGRLDVYSKRGGKANPKTGKVGYYTQCWNFWKDGICPKKTIGKYKCSECVNQKFKQLTGQVVMEHLHGKKEDGSDVIGLYPMLADETCNFLVFDFDNHDNESSNEWIEDVEALRKICRINEVPILVERSRSGKGAHIWMFFSEPILAKDARKFGAALLTKGAESVNQKNFKSYDRMIPAQDKLPEGGLGNLIALPLQGQALKNGNSAFVDENWNVYPNQWKVLYNTKKISKEFVNQKIAEWGKDGIFGILSVEENDRDIQEELWKKKNDIFSLEDVLSPIKIIKANQIYIEKTNIKPRLQNKIRRLAAFNNPEFYKKRAMGFSTYGISSIVSCSYDTDKYICIPRGCEDNLLERLDDSKIPYFIDDERQHGNSISVDFVGDLYQNQQDAVNCMLQKDIGVLCAATSFGKTAVGINLIAQRKVNTLILVHNTEIMKNWIDELNKFLMINEELPTYKTPSGKLRKRKSLIGRLQSSHNSLTGIIDVAMISSLGQKGDINQIVKDYGMVIMDECHHVGAQTMEEVLNEVNAKYVYGLSATPKREDGMQKKIFFQFGPIRYKFTSKDRLVQQNVNHYVYPRFTSFIHPNANNLTFNKAASEIIEDKRRNDWIIEDVKKCIKEGRSPIVITKSKKHASYLYEHLKNVSDHIFLLQGSRGNKEKGLTREQMKLVKREESVIIVATGQYIGEGFNYPRLDTLMLTMPISYEVSVEQYLGRLHRDYEGKEEVIIYDYVDTHIRVLEKMYHKRLKTYKKIGYKVCTDICSIKQDSNSIFDYTDYENVFNKDLCEANKEIIISSPGISRKRINQLFKVIEETMRNGLNITFITLDADSYPKEMKEKTKTLIDDIKKLGVNVITKNTMYEHFAIIDRKIVWYGNTNYLSKTKEGDNMMRVVSDEIAQELLEKSLI